MTARSRSDEHKDNLMHYYLMTGLYQFISFLLILLCWPWPKSPHSVNWLCILKAFKINWLETMGELSQESNLKIVSYVKWKSDQKVKLNKNIAGQVLKFNQKNWNIARIVPENSRRWPTWRTLGFKQKKIKNDSIFLSEKFFYLVCKFCIFGSILKVHLIQLLNWTLLSIILIPASNRFNELW